MGGVGGRREIGGSDIIIFILKKVADKVKSVLKRKLPSGIHSNASLYCALVCEGRMSEQVPHAGKGILELRGKGKARV